MINYYLLTVPRIIEEDDFSKRIHHGGADHFPGDHYHVKQLSSAPPPGKTKPVWFRLENTDPLSPTTPGGGTFAAGDLLPAILQ